MNYTTRVLTTVALAVAALTMTGTAHADDLLGKDDFTLNLSDGLIHGLNINSLGMADFLP